MSDQQNKNNKKPQSEGHWVAIGVVLGITMGLVLDNLAIGVAVGTAIGAAFAAGIGYAKKDDNS